MSDPVIHAGEVASAPSFALLLTLWLPVFSVVVWFLYRLFNGRWLSDVQDEGADPAPDRYEPTGERLGEADLGPPDPP